MSDTGKRKHDPYPDIDEEELRKIRRTTDTVDRALASPAVEPKTRPIAELLDVTTLNDATELSDRFNNIAHALFHDYVVSVTKDGKQTEYQILELEFYLQKAGCHEDPFTHGSEEQERSGQWYFHRAPTRSSGSSSSARVKTAAGGYRGGTRKGMDLTFGGPVPSTYFSSGTTKSKSATFLKGGILLRSLRRLTDEKVISGPSLLVDEILRVHGASNISELVETTWSGDISALSSRKTPTAFMYLKDILPVGGAKPRIYSSPRIGLDLSNPEATTSLTNPRVVFVSRPYRYFINPHLLTANGRGQTFLGVYRHYLSAKEDLLDEAALRRQLTKLTGIKEDTLVKYIADYKAGLDKGQLASFVGASGKGASASPTMFLKMMGTLERAWLNIA